MRKSTLFFLICSFGLGVELLNAQDIAPPTRFDNEAARASGVAAVPLVGRPTPVALQKYVDLPFRLSDAVALNLWHEAIGYAMDIRGASARIAVPGSGVSSTVGMEFVHGRQAAAIPEKELPGKVNYILGNNPRKWRLGLPTYERVTYRDLYPGVDVVYYGNQNQLEFDLVLKPGADVKSVRMRFSGRGKPHTDASGSLIVGDLRLIAPRVIQGKKTIFARYKMLPSEEVAFEVGATIGAAADYRPDTCIFDTDGRRKQLQPG